VLEAFAENLTSAVRGQARESTVSSGGRGRIAVFSIPLRKRGARSHEGGWNSWLNSGSLKGKGGVLSIFKRNYWEKIGSIFDKGAAKTFLHRKESFFSQLGRVGEEKGVINS